MIPVDEPRLYILDDDPLMAELVAMVGRTVGFQPRIIEDPGTVAALLAEDPKSALVLDLVMPDLDGLEILKILGKGQFKGPILVLSGMDDLYLEAASRSALRLGLTFSGAVSKPIDPLTLEEAISKLKRVL